MSDFPTSKRNTINRLPQRGHYDAETIYSILDEALICHVAFTQDNEPFVIPCLYARLDDSILLHGAKASRLMKYIQEGGQVSIAVSLIDGLVVARSVFHHSVNYRSVVLFGKGTLVKAEAEKMHALEVITEHILPGRWAEARKPTPKELNATTVVSLPIESASAKVRTGQPGDDEDDYKLPIWAGVLPLSLQASAPINDPLLMGGIPVPSYVSGYKRGK